MKKGALKAMKVVMNAQYADVFGAVKKMGVFVDASKGIILQNLSWPQIRVQLFALFSFLVPLGRG